MSDLATWFSGGFKPAPDQVELHSPPSQGLMQVNDHVHWALSEHWRPYDYWWPQERIKARIRNALPTGAP